MLQQGKFVGDILYFVGEDPHATVPHESQLNPLLPDGYDYDYVNGEALLTQLSVKDGCIVTPNGTSYRLLVLGERKRLTLKTLRKLREMVEKGMCLLTSSRPEASPSLADYQYKEEFNSIVNELQGDLDGKNVRERRLGKGRIFLGLSVGEALKKLGVKPDFEFSTENTDAIINYIHRQIRNFFSPFIINIKVLLLISKLL